MKVKVLSLPVSRFDFEQRIQRSKRMSTNTTSNRRACDRCRRHKLRCPRNDLSNHDSCSRCLNAGAQCIYSPSLPTGRPAAGLSATRKAAAQANQSPSSFASQLPIDTSTWTLPDQDPFTAHIDGTSDAWNPQPMNLDNLFDTDLDVENDSIFDTLVAAAYSESGDMPSLPAAAPSIEVDVPRSSLNGDVSNSEVPKAIDNSEVCIRQLADLSVRLYIAYRCTCSFGKRQKDHPGALLSSGAFGSVAHFLQGDDHVESVALGGCKVLYEIFLSSKCLADILHQCLVRLAGSNSQNYVHQSALRDIEAAQKHGHKHAIDMNVPLTVSPLPVPVETPPLQAASSTSTSSAQSTPNFTERNPPPSNKDSCPDGVILHLVLACYIRVLHIHHIFISALYSDALNIVHVGSDFGSSFLQLRLVMLVQLISHLLDRLRRAMVAYATLLDKEIDGAREPQTTGSMRSDDLGRHSAIFGNVPELERSVNQDLVKLQQIIRT